MRRGRCEGEKLYTCPCGRQRPKNTGVPCRKMACMGRLCFMRPGNPHKQRIFTELSRKRNCFFTLFFYNKKRFLVLSDAEGDNMKKGMSKTQKWALVAGAALLALLLILAAAAALYINSKMSLLSRPAAASANAESITPEDSILSFRKPEPG